MTGSSASAFVRFRTFVFLSIFGMLTGCDFTLFSPSPTFVSGTYSNPGSYALFGQFCYSSPLFFNLDNQDLDGNPTFFTNTINQDQGGWNLADFVRDDNSGSAHCPYNSGANVQASDFVSSRTTASDFLWFSGHGGGGLVALLDAGDLTNGYNAPIGGLNTFGGNYPGLAQSWTTNSLGQGLKWVFLNSSQSVRNDAQAISWVPAFNAQQNGIHGVYGFEGEPSSMSTDLALSKTFLGGALGTTSNPNPMSVQSAWIHAAMAAGEGGVYGVYELTTANDDTLSGPPRSGNPPYTLYATASSGNPVVFYDAANGQPTFPVGVASISQAEPVPV